MLFTTKRLAPSWFWMLLAFVVISAGCKYNGKSVGLEEEANLDIGGATTTTTTTTSVTTTTVSNRYFPDGAIWYQDISSAALDSQSTAIINWLNTAGGWGNSNKFEVDFSFMVLQANASTPMVPFSKKAGYYSPDCDNLTTFPLPTGGAIEGEAGYTCAHGGDCHILVVNRTTKQLWESGNSNYTGGNLQSMCGILWDLSKVYPADGRGDQCTSTDAAGYPIAPLLFNADEIAAGEINHAIRFILPNNRMKKNYFVHPATHAGSPSSTGTAPYYGMRFRLKSSFNISVLKPAAQVVAKALKKYGMLLADGGQIALTAESDRFTTAKWAAVDFASLDLNAIRVTDFEIVDGGTRILLDYNCVRNP